MSKKMFVLNRSMLMSVSLVGIIARFKLYWIDNALESKESSI